MATFHISTPDNFDFAHPESWPQWHRRFERFREASGLDKKPEKSQISTLIYAMGDRADDILRLSDDDKKYSVVVDKFENYFVRKRNVIYERAKLNRRRQEEGETVDEFITSLYALAKHCNYGSLHDEMIRDRVVVGLRNAQLAEKLQLDPDLTVESATAKARQSEAVKRQQPVVRGANTTTDQMNTDVPIDAIRKHTTRQPRQSPTLQHRPQLNNNTARDVDFIAGLIALPSQANAYRMGHYTAVCLTRPTVQTVHVDVDAYQGNTSTDEDPTYLLTIDHQSSPWQVTITVDNVPIEF